MSGLYGLLSGAVSTAYDAASNVFCARRAPAAKKGQQFHGVVPGIDDDDEAHHGAQLSVHSGDFPTKKGSNQHSFGTRHSGASSVSAGSAELGSIAVVSDGVEPHSGYSSGGRGHRTHTFGADGEEEGEADVEAGEGSPAAGEEASEGVVVIYIPERDLYFMPVNNTQVDRQGLIELMRDAGMEGTLSPEVTAETLSHEDAVYILVDHGVTVYYGAVTDEAEGTLELYDPFEAVEEGGEGVEVAEEGGHEGLEQGAVEEHGPTAVGEGASPRFVAAPPLPPAGVPPLPVLPVSRASSTGSAFPAPSPLTSGGASPLAPSAAFRGPPPMGGAAARVNAPPSPFTPFGSGGVTPPPAGAASAAVPVGPPSGRWA